MNPKESAQHDLVKPHLETLRLNGYDPGTPFREMRDGSTVDVYPYRKGLVAVEIRCDVFEEITFDVRVSAVVADGSRESTVKLELKALPIETLDERIADHHTRKLAALCRASGHTSEAGMFSALDNLF